MIRLVLIAFQNNPSGVTRCNASRRKLLCFCSAFIARHIRSSVYIYKILVGGIKFDFIIRENQYGDGWMIRKWKVGNIQFLRNFAAIQDKQVSQNHFETVHSLRNSVKATVPREFKCFFLLINKI